MARITITPEHDFRPAYQIEAPNHLEAKIWNYQGVDTVDFYDSEGTNVCCVPLNGRLEIEYAE